MSAKFETRLTSLVDPFLGNGASDPPPTQGLAATWFWPKAQTGNTHPGACYPYGKVSACAYSGAYVTGYGLNMPSYDGQPDRLFEEYTATGFAHFQQSGTGAIGSYYNYLRVTPLSGEFSQMGSRWALEDEKASPGRYSARLAGTGICAELTVSRRVAVHRYSFADRAPATIAVDVSAGGLALESMRTIPTAAAFEVLDRRTALGWVVVEGIRLYFYLLLDAPADVAGTWSDGVMAPDQLSWAQDAIDPESMVPFGVSFRFATGVRQIEVKVGFSLQSIANARADVDALGGQSFGAVAEETCAFWETYLSRIHVTGGTLTQQRIFRSMQYFSLIKPADFGEPPWDGDCPFFFDLATLWDMYKTQLPLMMTLYPERGRDLVNAILNTVEHFGVFNNGLVMNTDIHQFDNQASCLAHAVLSDAYVRGLDGIDWTRALRLMSGAFESGRAAEFMRDGKVLPYTHTLDLAYAAFLTARLARDLGEQVLADKLMAVTDYWRNVYDTETGLLSQESPYYEGTYWNYSFRLFHDMAGRIGLFESEEAFVETLDRFFGSGRPPCTQVVHRPYGELMAQGFALGRFEGLNNEPDMEVPYAYIYAGRPDRTARIVREVMAKQYHTGRGGLPGNDDSGGTASWYVWSAIGLFPVAGQDILLIGSPVFDSVTLTVNGASFTVEARGNSEEAIYVQRATLNGAGLERAYLRYAELSAGGTLVLEMGTEPSEWGRRLRPPSYGRC